MVTGAAGMLGSDLVAELRGTGADVLPLGRGDLDVTDAHSVSAAVEGVDVVVNCATFTAVDNAEEREAEAFAVNAVGPVYFARACDRHGAVLVQLSTDYVVAGEGDDPHQPDASVSPVNAY
jgi:dTDP-4-dehydrorhamnose reductase